MIASTSRAAFANVKVARNEEIVYKALEDLGIATNDQIADKLGWEIQSVTGRTNSLFYKGLIEVVDKNGVTRMGNKAKRWGIKYKQPPKAVSWLYDED